MTLVLLNLGDDGCSQLTDGSLIWVTSEMRYPPKNLKVREPRPENVLQRVTGQGARRQVDGHPPSRDLTPQSHSGEPLIGFYARQIRHVIAGGMRKQ